MSSTSFRNLFFDKEIADTIQYKKRNDSVK